MVADAAHLANLEQPAAVDAALLAHLDPAGTGPAERGEAVRRAVLGDAHVDRAAAASSPLTEPFPDLITRYAWGDVSSRPGLDRRTRSLLTLALLDRPRPRARAGDARPGRADQRRHAREGVGGAAAHRGPRGVPTADRAFAVAQRVLEQPEPGSA